MNKYQLAPYLQFVEPYYSEKDSAHDFQHIQRIVSRLSWISEGVMPRPEFHRLCFLACFHGLGKRMQTDIALKEKTKAFLVGFKWSKGEIDEIFDSLARHLTDPQTVEEKIVHDANYVETLGAYGIAKAFTTGGANGQSIEDTMHIFEHQYLDRVVFQTSAGKRYAEKMGAYAKAFINQLKDELNVERNV